MRRVPNESGRNLPIIFLWGDFMAYVRNSISESDSRENFDALIITDEISRKNKYEIKAKYVKNSAKCKQLFSNKSFLWNETSVLVSGYEYNRAVVYAICCADSDRFCDDALRSAFLLDSGISPSASIAVSEKQGIISLKAFFYSSSFKENSESLIPVALAALRARRK